MGRQHETESLVQFSSTKGGSPTRCLRPPARRSRKPTLVLSRATRFRDAGSIGEPSNRNASTWAAVSYAPNLSVDRDATYVTTKLASESNQRLISTSYLHAQHVTRSTGGMPEC